MDCLRALHTLRILYAIRHNTLRSIFQFFQVAIILCTRKSRLDGWMRTEDRHTCLDGVPESLQMGGPCLKRKRKKKFPSASKNTISVGWNEQSLARRVQLPVTLYIFFILTRILFSRRDRYTLRYRTNNWTRIDWNEVALSSLMNAQPVHNHSIIENPPFLE